MNVRARFSDSSVGVLFIRCQLARSGRSVASKARCARLLKRMEGRVFFEALRVQG